MLGSDDQVLRTVGHLLRDLLVLDRLCEVVSELHFRKRQFADLDVELTQTVLHYVPDSCGDLVSFVDELGGGVASDD